jgi:hypothetical protein
MPRPLGRCPAGGFSLSSLSFSMAWKHLDMWSMTCTGEVLCVLGWRQGFKDVKQHCQQATDKSGGSRTKQLIPMQDVLMQA